ncbi:Asparagine--tRNA ligase [Candidatus Norongarragalina meridionalis]|nr:Asparagine--tRNA ligase [Candidatus Norongarragalina meridionalis]
MQAQLEMLKSTEGRFQKINGDEFVAIDRVNDALYWGALEYFHENGFTWMDVPTITRITGACENVDTLYSVEHFGRQAYLAQTGQLYLEAKIPRHSRVWTVITSSRAEASADERHLNQFQLLEFEHQGDFESMLANVEGTVKAMLRNALKNARPELEFLGRDVAELETYLSPFNRITYTDAVKLLSDTHFQIAWGDDLKRQHELFLVQALGGKPLFITHFPTAIKFFNMRQNRDNPLVVNSADLIMPYSGEAVGSAERENDYDILYKRLLESPMYRILSNRGVSIEEFGDYLAMVKQNPILHSGCGIGFSRISQSAMGLEDIRQCTSYPLNAETLY